jgi:hypothetical protein
VNHAPRTTVAGDRQGVFDLRRGIQPLRETYLADPMHGANLVDRPLNGHPALVHHRDVIAHALHLIEQMRGEDHGATVFDDRAHDRVQDVLANHHVEPAGGFIEYEQIRTMRDGHDQPGLRTHALRQL